MAALLTLARPRDDIALRIVDAQTPAVFYRAEHCAAGGVVPVLAVTSARVAIAIEAVAVTRAQLPVCRGTLLAARFGAVCGVAHTFCAHRRAVHTQSITIVALRAGGTLEAAPCEVFVTQTDIAGLTRKVVGTRRVIAVAVPGVAEARHVTARPCPTHVALADGSGRIARTMATTDGAVHQRTIQFTSTTRKLRAAATLNCRRAVRDHVTKPPGLA